MRFFSLLVLILVPSISNAQKSKGVNNVIISLTPQYYLNKLNIRNDEKLPNPISAKNTLGYSVGLDYERTTRYGLIYGVGAHYGIRRHDVEERRDFSGFDPDATYNLRNVVFSHRHAFETHHLSPRVLVGYKIRLNSAWSIPIKVAASGKYYVKDYVDDELYKIVYYTDDGSQQRSEDYLRYSGSMGGNGVRRFVTLGYEFYVGAERTYVKGFIKNLSVGLIATHISRWQTGVSFLHTTSIITRPDPLTPQRNASYDEYVDRDISIGVRLGVGLWK